jgi:hypothetical protein
MAYENIRLDEPAFCAAGEYFFSMKPAPTNMLTMKTSNGDPVMTYPFSNELTVVENSFLSIQYDGVNIWSLEKRTVASNNEKERILRRWRLENFTCVLKDSWRVRGQSGEDMNGGAFAIENYHNTLAQACGPGAPPNEDRIVLTYPHAAFFHVTDQFYISSATIQGRNQELPVATSPNANTVTVSEPFAAAYAPGDPVILRRDLYFFNNQSPALGAASAAVYQFRVPHMDAVDPTALNELTYIGCHDSGIYEGTSAATFLTTSGNIGINNGDYTGVISYVRGMQLLMKRPNMPGGGLTYPGGYVGTNQEFKSNIASMLMDTAIKNDRVTLHTIYDLGASVHTSTCISVNIYRLQRDYTYGSVEGAWTTYNYVVSVMKPMVTSIALTADPALVVANGVDRSFIVATVRDQYGAALNGKRVVFEISAADEAQKGYFLCPDSISPCSQGSFTWLDTVPHKKVEILSGSQWANIYSGTPAMQGQAIIEWRAGTTAGLVTIVATVQP